MLGVRDPEPFSSESMCDCSVTGVLCFVSSGISILDMTLREAEEGRGTKTIIRMTASLEMKERYKPTYVSRDDFHTIIPLWIMNIARSFFEHGCGPEDYSEHSA